MTRNAAQARMTRASPRRGNAATARAAIAARIGNVTASGARRRRVERAQQPQRIAIAVLRAVSGADNGGTDLRHPLRDSGVVEHVDVVLLETRLRHERTQMRGARIELL